MVRLKVYINKVDRNISKISIPYGAIKRETKKAILLIGSAFQFLMVRLKGAQEICREVALADFNSLWCD